MPTPQKAWMLLERLRDSVTIAASVIVIVAGGYAAVRFTTGGFRPTLQVDVDGLSQGLARVQTDVGAIKKRVEEMPRPADFAAQEQHLGRLDARTDALGDRMTRDEIEATNATADLKARVNRLEIGTSTAVRNPR